MKSLISICLIERMYKGNKYYSISYSVGTGEETNMRKENSELMDRQRGAKFGCKSFTTSRPVASSRPRP